jgi:hypothetical protein
MKYKRYGKIAGCIQSDGTVLYFEMPISLN